jgi:dTDP-4-dehydrorhamnose 3,5-epimerase
VDSAGFRPRFLRDQRDRLFAYKCTALYSVADELGVVWNDPAFAIPWPVAEPQLSAKDKASASLGRHRSRAPAALPGS